MPIVYWNQIRPSFDAADFVEGILVKQSMSVVYGQSNSGKTFFVADMALHVASGLPWAGRQVERGSVLWLAMEGSHGIFNRIAAWRQEKDLDTAQVNIAVIPVSLNLLDPTADLGPLLDAIREVGSHFDLPVIWTIVDTLSRAISGGNENSPEDMGALVTNGVQIQQAGGCALTWIHHAGKDETKGARGHSLLRAACDTEIEISAEGQARMARVTKQREMECAGEIPFTLKVVTLGMNRREKAVTACVVVHSYQVAGATSERKTRFAGHMRRALDVLADLIAASGEMGYPGTPCGVRSVPDKWWRERFLDRAMPDQSAEARRKAFSRASTDLLNAKAVGYEKGRVWMGRASDEKEPENASM